MPMAELHPAVQRALALASSHGTPARQAAAPAPDAALRHLLRDRSPAEPAAWNDSKLGRSGFPVEISIAFGRPELRYTVEPAGPDTPPARRLSRAGAAIAALSDESIEPADLAAIASFQDNAALAYGAWIGGRHGAGKPRFKLYAEVPGRGAEHALAWGTRHLGDLSGIVRRGAWPVMAGWQPAGRRAELYLRTRRLFRADVPLLMAAARLEHRADEVLGLLQDACCSAIEAALPAADFGVSIGAGPDGASTFTLYAVANDLFGGDGRIRETVLRVAAARGWDTHFYRALSEPLAGASGFVTRHGMFGIVVASDQPATVAIGLTPDHPETSS
ncbi:MULTISPECIES: hypothetical protein [Burkholderia]|uniref:hypothetical protein n=1 Tax=Burkholderia TaxID=32008 RepID=UPI000F59FA9E|nr:MULTISPECIES: hypothetical protein [Burkholderia]MBN3741007.1 hypothetical protein [Burkholderia sp. Tr-20355]